MNPAMNASRQVCTRRAGAHRIPACSKKTPIFGPSWYLSTIFWASLFLPLDSCCMTLASPGVLLFDFLALLVPDRRALMRSRSLDFTYFEIRNHATMAAPQIAISTIAKFIAFFL